MNQFSYHQMKAHSKAHSVAAFTLVELMVTIAVVGILSGLVLVGLQSSLYSAKRAESMSLLRGYGVALNLYASENKSLPGPLWVGQVPEYTGSPNYLATHIWPYFQADEPLIGSIPDWLVTSHYRTWYENQSSKSGKLAYMLPRTATTQDGGSISLFGYPDPDTPIAQSNWTLLMTNTDLTTVRIMYETAATSRSPNRSPQRGEIQNYLAELYLDGHIEFKPYH